MITESEQEMINELNIDDFYAPLVLITLSRYDRLRKEAAQLNQALGPADFVAIIEEAYNDCQVYSAEELT